MPKGALPAVESSLSVTQRFWPVGRGKAGQNLSMKMKPCLTKRLHLMLNADAMKQGKNESFFRSQDLLWQSHTIYLRLAVGASTFFYPVFPNIKTPSINEDFATIVAEGVLPVFPRNITGINIS